MNSSSWRNLLTARSTEHTRAENGQPYMDSGPSCFSSYYSQWLQSAGARVVPLRYNQRCTIALSLSRSQSILLSIIPSGSINICPLVQL